MIRGDGCRSYLPASKSYTHEHELYNPDSGLSHWLHIVISNAKAFILSPCQGLPKTNMQSCLDGYSFRFQPPRLWQGLSESSDTGCCPFPSS